jgi:hypothetical protein
VHRPRSAIRGDPGRRSCRPSPQPDSPCCRGPRQRRGTIAIVVALVRCRTRRDPSPRGRGSGSREGAGAGDRGHMADCIGWRRSPAGAGPCAVGQSSRRWKPQTGQVATPRSTSSSRKLAQPFVLQKSRWLVALRRRSRRMEADRPTTVLWNVRVSMGCSMSFVPRSVGRFGPRTAVLVARRRVRGDGAMM